MSQPTRQKTIALTLLSAVLLGAVLFAAPRPVRAVLGAGDTSVTVADVPRTIFQTITKITTAIYKKMESAFYIAWKNQKDIFLATVTKKITQALETTAPGKQPLFLTKPMTFFQDVGNAAAGDFIDDFAKGLTGGKYVEGQGIVGGRSGPKLDLTGKNLLTSAKSRFLVTQILRDSLLSSTGDTCTGDCDAQFGYPSDIDVAIEVKLDKIQSFDEIPGANETDKAHVLLMIRYGDSSVAEAKDPTTPTLCPDVIYDAGSKGWVFSFGHCDPRWGPMPADCIEMPVSQCSNHISEATDTLLGEADTQNTECRKGCIGGATSDAIQGYLKSRGRNDIFKDVQKDLNRPIGKSATEIANALSNDQSDIGRTFGALSALTSSVDARLKGEETGLHAGVIPRTSTVSKRVLSPVEASNSLFGFPITNAEGQPESTGNIAVDIIKGVVSFLNSPVGKALFKYFQDECGVNPESCKGPTNPRTTIGKLIFGQPGATTKLQYNVTGKADIKSGNPGKNEIDVATQLSASGLIDPNFQSAINERVMLQDAFKESLISPSTPIGFDRNGQEVTNGVSYRALQYLRKFRITPVGWEIAALYSQKYDQRDLTLEYLVGQFNICGQDNDHKICLGSNMGKAGQACQEDAYCGVGMKCGASPYCGLVDPTWVLKAPQTFCRRSGAGEEILTKIFICDENNINKENGDVITGKQCGPSYPCKDDGAPNCVPSETNTFPDIGRWEIGRNAETCADTQACIAENDDGTCKAFGYCMEERPTFKFDGDQCRPEYVTCNTFTNSVGQKKSYLENTLDQTNCSAELAGCQWYCRKTCSTQPSTSCSVDSDCPNGGTCGGGYNKTTGTWQCAATGLCNNTPDRLCFDNSGCLNGETCVMTVGYCDDIIKRPCNNSSQCAVNVSCVMTSKINYTGQVKSCTKSQNGCRWFTRTGNGTNLLANGGFEYFTGIIDDAAPASFYNWSVNGAQLHAVTASDSEVTVGNQVAALLTGAGPNYTWAEVNFNSPIFEKTLIGSVRAKSNGGACTANLGLMYMYGALPPITADTTSIALTNEWATYTVSTVVPTEGAWATPTTAVSLKIALDTCGGVFIDSAQIEDGTSATAYKSYGMINALYLNSKRLACMAEEVGCERYRPVGGGNTINAVARPSDQCDEANVGCDRYKREAIAHEPYRDYSSADGGATKNGVYLNIVAPKGESCSARDVGCEEYTNLDEVAKGGEGKVTYSAVKQCIKPDMVRAEGPQAQTYYTWVGDANKGFVLQSYQLVSSESGGDPAILPPCTHLSIGKINEIPTCDDTQLLNACAEENVGIDPDCGEYYDSDLHVFYKLRSKTVTVTDDCHPFRNTIDATDPDYQLTETDNIYYLSREENTSCSANAGGCRAFVGNSGRVNKAIFNDDFKKGSSAAWESGTVTGESINAGDSSLRVNVGQAAVTVASATASKLKVGKLYTIKFTAAAAGSIAGTRVQAFLGTYSGGVFTPRASFQSDDGGAAVKWNSNTVPPGPQWNQYTLGPLRLDEDPTDWRLSIVALNPGCNAVNPDACLGAHVDNIQLTQINDSLYLINNSAPGCPDDQVGCKEYRDRANDSHYLKSFQRLCSDAVVGCEALIDTQNSTAPMATTVKYITTPADRFVTLVNNKTAYCPATAKGCSVFGLPAFGPDQAVTSYKNIQLIDDPDRYSADLCENESLGCQIYSSATGQISYFKDPGKRTCSYTNNAWAITGTAVSCPVVTPPEVTRPIGKSCSPVCTSGKRAGKPCTGVLTCEGGTNNGKTCLNNAQCPGLNATCVSKECPANIGDFIVPRCNGDPQYIGKINEDGFPVIGSCVNSSDCFSAAGQPQNTCVYLAGICPQAQSGCTEYRDPYEPAGCRTECPLAQRGTSPVAVDYFCTPTTCLAGVNAGKSCVNDEQCLGSSCVGTENRSLAGKCSVSGASCQTTAECLPVVAGETCNKGIPGCRPYYYLRQTVEDNAGECDGNVDLTVGCRPFNDPSKKTLNILGE